MKITKQRNLNCSCCNEPMIKIGTKVKIVDNFVEHLNYKQDTILEIIQYDEDGYYILNNGSYCSEGEIETIN
jgi:hypothetical protein